jgi:hypothetical protein
LEAEILVIYVADWQEGSFISLMLIIRTSLKELEYGEARQLGSMFFVLDVGTRSLDLIGSSGRFSA